MENNVTISTHNGSQVARQHNLRNPKVIAKEDHIDPNGHFEVWLEHKGTGLLCWSKKDGANLRRLLIYIAFRRGLFRNCLYKSNPQ